MIGSTLQQELMSIIMRELNDPRLVGMPSITRVKVAADLGTADVFVTIMATEGKQTAALNALKHSAGMMRQKLQKTLPMRTIPFLKFHLDEALKQELSVLDLIDKAVKEENELKASRDPGATDDHAVEPSPADETASSSSNQSETESDNPQS